MKYYFYESIDNKKGRVFLEYSIEPPKEMLEFPHVKAIVENPKDIEGKFPVLYINLENNELYYEYEDNYKTEEEILKERIASLELAMANVMGM